MRRLVAVENVSLDGVMQAPARGDEDDRGDFAHGGWAFDLLSRDPEAVQRSMGSGAGDTVMLFGRVTYLDLVGHWLATTDPNPFTGIIRDATKYVASRTLTEPLPHPNSVLLPDAVAGVTALKQDGDGDVVVLGSGALLRELAAAGLVDAYQLTILPVVLGGGTRLFGPTYAALTVSSSFVSPTGIVVATYEVEQPGG